MTDRLWHSAHHSSRYAPFARRGAYASRYQFARRQNARSHAVWSAPLMVLARAFTVARRASGRSALKCVYVSRFDGSELPNTAGVTAFSSMSMPARPAACFTIAWIFCREALIVV